jgi:adenosine deaminase
MGPAQSDPQLNALPKIDLHRHLEGSVRLATVHELAESGRIPLSSDLGELERVLTVRPGDPRTHDHFLSRFVGMRSVFQSEGIIRRITAEAVADMAAESIRYAELHVTPIALATAGGFKYGDVLRWVLEAIKETAQRTTTVKIVVSLNRHESITEAERVLRAAVEFKEDGVVGVDLAGDEARYPAKGFRGLFHKAKAEGLHISVHAGEWAGPNSVRQAIEDLGADRIAHGIRVMEDKDAVVMARERRIPFAVCLTSNVQSGVVDGYSSHPLPLMIQAGLQVCLNSDDPAISSTDLNREYKRAITELGLAMDTLKGMILSGAQASFLADKPRKELEATMQNELGLALASDASD